MKRERTPEAVKSWLYEFLVTKLGISADKVWRLDEGEALTGFQVGLLGRDLMYLFLEAELEFEIHISEEQLKNYHFNTMAGIVDTLCFS